MKKNLSELVFILDKSGSMSGLEKDTIGGFNSMLEKQRGEAGECLITTALFDNNYELLHDRTDIRGVKPITEKDYYVGGSTALLDAIGRTLSKITAAHRTTSEEYTPEKVMVVIITDGEENASREYSFAKVKAKIEELKKSCGWEFIFLGANIDAVETAGSIGISSDRALNYVPDEAGTACNFKAVACAAASFRSVGRVLQEDLEIINSYTESRKKKN